MGKPEVIATKLFKDIPLAVAACETNSEHPLSKAIMNYVRALEGVVGSDVRWLSEAREFQNIPGQGVRAVVAGKDVVVGSRKLMKELGITLPKSCTDFLEHAEQKAQSCVLVALENEVVGAIGIADPVKPEAAEVISTLASMGCGVYW